MNLQEMGTVMEQGLPLKIFVLNNKQLGMVRQLQEFYCDKRYMATEFQYDLDFAALARAYGMAAYTIATAAELEQALPEIIALKEPVLVNCLVSDTENVLPMVLAGASIDEAID
jgi:acetolactate synthase-1/2/3 large subunit